MAPSVRAEASVEAGSRPTQYGQDGIFVDTLGFPLVYLELRGILHLDHVRALRVAMGEIIERGEPFVVVSNTRLAMQANPLVRRAFAEYASDFVPHRKTLVIESVVVIESPIVRLAYQALQWMMPEVTQNVVVADVASAADIVERAWRDAHGEPSYGFGAALSRLRRGAMRPVRPGD